MYVVLIKELVYSNWEKEITIPAGTKVFVCPIKNWAYWKGDLVHIEGDEYEIAS
jgi:hypothetical protein